MITVDPKTSALFLDVDGTLLEIREDPGDVVASQELLDTLGLLQQRFNGAVAIVSGRQIRDIDRILSPLNFVAAGVHGIQVRAEPGGAIHTHAPKLPEKLVIAIEARMVGLKGIVVEPKDEAIAVHYRLAPQHRAEVKGVLLDIVENYGRQLEVSQGRMVFEIVPRSCSKGEALRRLAALPRFAHRMPIMIGDDEPDLSAIQTARQMNGLGLTVGGEFFPMEKADFRSPADVRSWLRSLTSKF